MELTADIFDFKTGWIKLNIFNFHHAEFFSWVNSLPQEIRALSLKGGERVRLIEEFRVISETW